MAHDTTIIVNNPPQNKISVIINDTSDPLKLLNTYISRLSSNLEKYELVSTNVISNSTTYLNLQEVEEVNFMQSLTSQWDETYHEVNTIQNQLSTSWQQTSEYISDGIIDAGFF